MLQVRPGTASAAPKSRIARSGCSGPLLDCQGPLDLGIRRLEPAKHGDRSSDRAARSTTPDRGPRPAAPGACLLLDPDPARGSRPKRRPASRHNDANWSNRLCGPQALEPLVSHPLGRELRQSRRRGPGRLPGLRDRWQTRIGGESKCPQDAEIVFRNRCAGSPTARINRPSRSCLPPKGSLHSYRSG